MPIIETRNFIKVEGKEYPNLPKKIYQCELLDVEMRENETYNSKTGKTNGVKEYEKILNWQFTILKGRDEKQEKEELKELRGRNVWDGFCKPYLYIGKNGKNSLYRIIEAFLGRELTAEEESKGISTKTINEFIGKQILVSIEPKTSKSTGKTFDNIIDYFHAEMELPSLSEEEKEKAKVKKDKKQVTTEEGVSPEIDEGVENINFN